VTPGLDTDRIHLHLGEVGAGDAQPEGRGHIVQAAAEVETEIICTCLWDGLIQGWCLTRDPIVAQ
jgi:hypothetical protein